MIRTVLAALFCVLISTAAQACDVMRPCYGDGRLVYGASHQFVSDHKVMGRRVVSHRRVPVGLARAMAEGAGRVVSHPAGCPSRAFCGCGASVDRFGRSIRSLWLARNWLRFPRSEPAPGRAAVRRDGHHVVILREHISGSVWLVFDANSGKHRTRVHPRSIAGFVIVDPSAGV